MYNGSKRDILYHDKLRRRFRNRYVIEELRTIPCVKEAHGIMGAYDIIAEIESPSREELQKTLTMKIRKMGMIRSTLTLVGIDGQRYSNY